jgi:hypothetical protein
MNDEAVPAFRTVPAGAVIDEAARNQNANHADTAQQPNFGAKRWMRSSQFPCFSLSPGSLPSGPGGDFARHAPGRVPGFGGICRFG